MIPGPQTIRDLGLMAVSQADPFNPILPVGEALAYAGKEPIQIVLGLFKEADFVFIGENHAVDDELFLREQAGQLKKAGVSTLAIEFPRDLQSQLDAHLKSDGKIPLHREVNLKMPAYYRFVLEAHRAGIRIKAVDVSSIQPKKPTPDERNREIARVLSKFKGKTLVMLGREHVLDEAQPLPATRRYLQNQGRKTAGIALESENSAKSLYLEFGLSGAYANRFFYENYAGNKLPFSFGILTGHPFLKDLHFKDTTCEGCIVGESDGLAYGQSLSAVIFLTPAESPLTGFAIEKFRKLYPMEQLNEFFGDSIK